MLFRIASKQGDIKVNDDIILQIILREMDNLLGDFVLCTKKGKVFKNFNDGVKGIIVKPSSKGITIDIYVIIKFGLSMFTTAEKTIKLLNDKLYEYLEIHPEKINIHIVGTRLSMSGKIVERDIEIKYTRGEGQLRYINHKADKFKENIQESFMRNREDGKA